MLLLNMAMLGCIFSCTLGNQWVTLVVHEDYGVSAVFTNSLWKQCTHIKGHTPICRDTVKQSRWITVDTAWSHPVRIIAVTSCVVSCLTVISSVVGFAKPPVSWLATVFSVVSGKFCRSSLGDCGKIVQIISPHPSLYFSTPSLKDHHLFFEGVRKMLQSLVPRA